MQDDQYEQQEQVDDYIELECHACRSPHVELHNNAERGDYLYCIECGFIWQEAWLGTHEPQ